MKPPVYEELEPFLKRALDPSKPQLLMALARGAAPLSPDVLVASWCYLSQHEDASLKEHSIQSISEYPEPSLLAALVAHFPAWALFQMSRLFNHKENVLESILLHGSCPVEVVMSVAPTCSEKLSILISNNQERIIEYPEIVAALESNPNNLKSNTDRLKQFLRLAGLYVFEPSVSSDSSAPNSEVGAVKIDSNSMDQEILTEEKRMSLHQFVSTLSIGAKVKLALKGNKEARSILIRDSNKTVATSVLKSPRINESEVSQYASLKNVAEDVIRQICREPTWVKLYPVKWALVNHPKTPFTEALIYLKSLTVRDLQQVTKSKTVQVPVRKAAKELLNIKRK
jgi:hypothetical protein